jgi:hypothetical protein
VKKKTTRMAFLEAIVGLLAIGIVIVLRYLLQNRGYLESLGIPVIKPVLFFGSPPFVPHKVYLHEFSTNAFKKLGKTWGRYDGRTPVISTIDPELIKSIMVKNFESFSQTLDWEMADNKLTLDLSSGSSIFTITIIYHCLLKLSNFSLTIIPK